MRKTYTLFTLLMLVSLTGIFAQDDDDNRYIEPRFEVMDVMVDTFATNISILTGSPVQQGLSVDVYMPMDDTATNRAVVAIFPTGNFLPAYINQGVYGTKGDSANVYLARQLAARGFVAMVAEYRQGWLPLATDQIVQTQTLLKAAYRGGQDAKALARYLRKTVVEDDNPYGIDEEKITFWGFGTGGYVVLTHAFLDSIAEIEQNLQFYDDQAEPELLVSEAVDGNPQGTIAAPLNLVNYPDYSDDVALTVMAGGAIGDTSWIESGPNNTDAFVGFHRVEDPNAPFNIGTVIVPTTGSSVINDVGGAYAIARITNREGINSELDVVNGADLADKFSDLSQSLNDLNETYQTMNLDTTDMPLSYDNLFPFLGEGGGHWNWSNEQVDRAFIAGINANLNAGLDADAIIADEKESNPNYNNPAAAKQVIDTMIAYFIPRAFVALDLGSVVSTDFLTPASVALDLFPNPAGDMGFTVRVSDVHQIRQVDLFDINGRHVRQMAGLDRSSVRLDRGTLPRGQYIVRIRLDDGVTARMVTLE